MAQLVNAWMEAIEKEDYVTATELLDKIFEMADK